MPLKLSDAWAGGSADSVDVGEACLIGSMLPLVEIDGKSFLRSGVVADQVDYPTVPDALVTRDFLEKYNAGAITTNIVKPLNTYLTMAYGNGLFVAVMTQLSTSTYYTSTDGVTWTARSFPVAFVPSAVGFGAGLFVVLKDYSAGSYTSPDGITWTSRAGPPAYAFNALSYHNGFFIATGNYSSMNGTVRSTDGINWVVPTVPTTTYACTPKSNGSIILLSAAGQNVYYSTTDMATFTARTLPNAFTGAISYANGHFYAADGSALYRSTDGLNWTQHTGLSLYPKSVYYTNGFYFSTKVTAGVATGIWSEDGLNWNSITLTYGSTVVVYLAENNCFFFIAANEAIYVIKGKPINVVGLRDYVSGLYVRVS